MSVTLKKNRNEIVIKCVPNEMKLKVKIVGNNEIFRI